MNREKTENLENAAIIAANILLAQPRPRVISPALLEVLARALKCEWATFWKVNDVEYVLEPAAIWKEASVITGRLERDTLHRTLSMSEGTAGHVWRSRKPIWTTNLARDMCIPRSLDAEHAGLQGGIWFALKSNTAMYGVIELLSHNLDPANKDVLIAIEHLGMVLGQLIEN